MGSASLRLFSSSQLQGSGAGRRVSEDIPVSGEMSHRGARVSLWEMPRSSPLSRDPT